MRIFRWNSLIYFILFQLLINMCLILPNSINFLPTNYNLPMQGPNYLIASCKHSCFQNKRLWNKLWTEGQIYKQFRWFFLYKDWLGYQTNCQKSCSQQLKWLVYINSRKSWIMLWKRRRYYSTAVTRFWGFFSLFFLHSWNYG